MKLLYSLTSPYARKVRVVAAEKRIEMEMVQVVLGAPDSEVNDFNPLGKIPVLVLDDGESIYDSRVIVEFLDHRTPLAHLIPQEHGQKIRVRRWESLADGVCDAAILARSESQRPAEKQDTSYIAKQMGKVERGLQVLNDELGTAKWCVNGSFSLADIALGCLLGYMDSRYPHLEWRDQYPNLARHNAELFKRPSFRDTVPPHK